MALLFAMPGNEASGSRLAEAARLESGTLEVRRFPDGESYVRILSPVAGEAALILCTLARPDEQFLPLLFAARTLREQGAASVRLVAPYLAYMRQDRRFRPGETITSGHFAELLSREFDGLVTIDPHLHRHRSLSDIYTIPATALSAAPALAEWIRSNVPAPLLVGPDEESEQWVAQIATLVDAPFILCRKDRRGDRDVEISVPDTNGHPARQPVLVDDIASSGRTLAEAARRLQEAGRAQPICAIVHALFETGALQALRPVTRAIVSTDTVPHETNAAPVAQLLARGIAES
ncbi:MAG: ribose-phosphate pyrophosphokinase [Allosphingosinicella sp.]